MDDDLKYRFDALDGKMNTLTDICQDQTEKLHKHDVRFEKYNNLLENHIEGVVQTRSIIKGVKDDLETHKEKMQPILDSHKGMKFIKKIVMGIGATAVAIYAVVRLLGLL